MLQRLTKQRVCVDHIAQTRWLCITRNKPLSRCLATLETPPFFAQVKDSMSHHMQPDSEWPERKLRRNIGKPITLYGYLGERVDVSKKLSFIPFHDPFLRKSIQLVSLASSDAHDAVKELQAHTPARIEGVPQARNAEAASSDKTTITELELMLTSIKPLNMWPADIITKNTVFPPEKRNLQLRTDESLRNSLHMRAQVAKTCRSFLSEKGFLEVETPILFKSTSEGAREFIVPTRKKGLAYALPQSPQQYKQILMASGIHRYYQFARCFRDEDGRADRQPEFTQLDLEMSFLGPETLMMWVSRLMETIFKNSLDIVLPPTPQMTYKVAMAQYGSDKPDLRFDTKIYDITKHAPGDFISKITSNLQSRIEAARWSFGSSELAKSVIREFLELPEAREFHSNPDGGPGVFILDDAQPLNGLQSLGFEAAADVEMKMQLKKGDVLIVQARPDLPPTGGSIPFGRFIAALNNFCAQQDHFPLDYNPFSFVWITDFPLFSPSVASEPGQGGLAGLASTHHPFTSPATPEDVDRLLTDPLSVTGDHYDLVLNGVEIGGGSKRIHHAEMQEYILKEILKLPPAKLGDFSHLLEALRAGCPPHCGIAFGFDRLIAVMLGKASVRDVIAFPKSGKGEDMLVKSPSPVTQEALDTYHLQWKQMYISS